MDKRFYINVRECMEKVVLPCPRLKRRVVSDGVQLLPIVAVEVDLWE